MADEPTVPLKKRIERAGGSWLVRSAAWWIRRLPSRSADAFGLRMGRAIFRLSRKYRERTLSNLRMCFPDWAEDKIRSTARRVFEHFGKTTARFFWASRMSDDEIADSVRLNGIEKVIDAALGQGKGVLVITAHFGNWERFAQVLTLKGYKLGVVARDANEERTTKLVNEQRRGNGVEVFSRGKAAREILRRLGRNELVAILPDQNTREIMVPFFGFPAGTNEGPAVMQLLTGAAILVGFCKEAADGTYDASAMQLDIPETTGDKAKDIGAIMALINCEIEKAIRETPEQWLWMHDRWRWAREQGLIS